MFRLHVDLPLNPDQTNSTELAKAIIEFLKTIDIAGVDTVQVKLSNDLDRGNKNYLDINENGHCSNKKIVLKVPSAE